MKCGLSIECSTTRSPNRVLTPDKVLTSKSAFIFCSSFQKIRLGGVKLLRKRILNISSDLPSPYMFAGNDDSKRDDLRKSGFRFDPSTILPLPNEDLGRRNKR